MGQKEYTALPTQKIVEDVVKIRFVYMFVEQITNLFFEQLPLDNIPYHKFLSLDQLDDALKFLNAETGVRLNQSDCERKTELFRIM